MWFLPNSGSSPWNGTRDFAAFYEREARFKKWFKYERTRNINLVRPSEKKVYFRVLVDVPTRSFSFLFLTKMNDGGPLHFHYMKQKSGLMAPTLLRNVSNALDVFKVWA